VIDDLGFDNFFPDSGEEEASRLRLNLEFATMIGLRDMLGISLKGARDKNATYKQAFALGRILIPQLFDENSILNRQSLSETARKYIQIAEAKSTDENVVLPEVILAQDIAEYEGYLQKESPIQDLDLLRKSVRDMLKALQELRQRKVTENSLIFRDAYQVRRELPVSRNGMNYREFKISNDRALRVRVLHPDKPEYSTGADLIYETYWEREDIKLVRLAAIQYKMWKNKSLYIDKRMEGQLEKLKNTFCDSTICVAGDKSKRGESYRLPYCSAFLRPSDELQSEDAALLSRGCYVPICVVKKQQQTTTKGNGVLYSKNIRSQAVTHKSFEELFNTSMLGSRWLTYSELENVYRSSGILETSDRIVIHAQELALDVE